MISSPRLLAPALVLLIGSLPMNAMADDKADTRTISVSGTGKVAAPPNVADISVGVITQAATAREALSANSERMTALQNVLKERGVAAKDIQTTQISVNPQYTQPPPFQPGQTNREFVPKIVGYQVQNTVQITSRDLAKLGTLLDAVVEAGANQMYGISFRIDEPGSLLDVARKKAMGDAKKRAELMAGEAGVVVGLPISIRDEAAMPPPPQPRMVAFRAAAAPAPVPVAAGEEEMSVTVHIVYELKIPQ